MEQGGFFNIPGLFGIGNGGLFTTPTQFQENLAKQKLMTVPSPSIDPSGNVGQVTQEQLQQGIGGAYNLETGQMQPGGIMGMLSNLGDSFSNMSADETMNLVQGLSGLLDATQPAPMDLRPISMPSASAGLRLQPIDLNQYYGSLLK
tara:strand:+ start:51 stop:491 length:441 start_codon:yes stop_codon:yes gene_type:complete